MDLKTQDLLSYQKLYDCYFNVFESSLQDENLQNLSEESFRTLFKMTHHAIIDLLKQKQTTFDP